MLKYQREFFLSSMIPATIVGVVGTVISSLWLGRSGFIAGLFAIFLVFFFLVVHLLVALVAPKVSPIAIMGLALGSYFIKIVGLVLCLLLLRPIDMNNRAFGVIAIATTTAWLAGEIWSFSTAWSRRSTRRK